jgi:multidrug resistance efflux pump
MTENKGKKAIEPILSDNPKPSPKKLNVLLLLRNNLDLIIALLIIIGLVGFVYWQNLQKTVYLEKAGIQAPIISISSPVSGVIQEVNVKEGDFVSKSKVLAVVSGREIYSETNGIVVGVLDTPGQTVSSQTSIIEMIDPRKLRVIARVQENKGLSDIKEGQPVKFTVDAFGSKKYEGFVESIAVTSRQSDIVFSISNNRQENEFDVKISYDIDKYPELKNGMSAKVWISKNF